MAAATPFGEERFGEDRLEGAGADCAAQPTHGRNVERRCAALARSGGALRRVLAALAGHFVAKRAWERLDHARLGDYARERLGLSARELQDLARVDAALATLPRVEAALVSGELGWTKVRLIARTAKPEDEAQWIAFAKRVKVRSLEQQVRAIDAGSLEAGAADGDPGSDSEAVPRRGVSVFVPPDIHAKWQLGWRLTRRVAGEALSIDRAAERICAEVLSALPLDPENEEEPPPRGMLPSERCLARWEQRREALRRGQGERLRKLFDRVGDETCEGPGIPPDPGPPASLRSLIEGLDRAEAHALDARLRRAVALEQRHEAELGRLLLHVARGRLYRLRGHTNLPAYTREHLGLAAGKAWALVRLERARATAPALHAAYRKGRLSWVKVQALLEIVSRAPQHERAWVAWAGRTTVRRLRDDVDRALLLAERDAEAFARSGGVPQPARVGASQATGTENVQTGAQPRESGAEQRGRWAPPGMARIFFTAPADVARLFRATLCSVRRRMSGKASEGDALDAMLEHCFEAWGVRDPKQERERKRRYRIFERDGWRCAVPGCTSYRNLHAHHIRFRSRGGGDEDANRITLCAWHHQRSLHDQGSLRITGRMPDDVRFELGVRPDGPPLAVYTGEDVLVSPSRV